MAVTRRVLCSKLSSSSTLKRSSHCVSVLGDRAFVFGGELLPRQPRDNDVFSVQLNAKGPSSAPTNVALNTAKPTPRVGATWAKLKDQLYLFSGRGGEAMAPIEENGGLWVFEPSPPKWNFLEPADSSQPYPQARSYHCTTSDGESKIYIHAGCPEKGRLADLWCFETGRRAWTQLPDAPGPQRGGTSIAYHNGRLYRMNGFDGKIEQGGQLDIFDVTSNEWSSISYPADGSKGPAARSVCALVPIEIGDKPQLITLFGEHDPSSLGHAGAGKMLGDVWAFDTEAKTWSSVRVEPDNGSEAPLPRGWFDAAACGKSEVFFIGGLGETNERLDDAWLLKF